MFDFSLNAEVFFQSLRVNAFQQNLETTHFIDIDQMILGHRVIEHGGQGLFHGLHVVDRRKLDHISRVDGRLGNILCI